MVAPAAAHGGGIGSGAAGVDLEAVFVELDGVVGHDHVHGGLGGLVSGRVGAVGAVGGVQRGADAAQAGGHEYDARVGRAPQERQEGLGQAGGTDGVGLERLGVLFPQRHGRRRLEEGDAGVVDQHVQPVEFPRHRVVRARYRRVRRDVQLERLNGEAGGQRRRRGLAFGQRPRAHEDMVVGILARELFGNLQANAFIGATDEHDLL